MKVTSIFPKIALGAFWITLGIGLVTAVYYAVVDPQNAPWLVIVTFNGIALLGIVVGTIVARIFDKFENS